MSSTERTQIFKSGSRTYYTSSLFFPPAKRQEVAVLYAFVRVADDYVDAIPQDAHGFHGFCESYRTSLKTGNESGNAVIDDFIELQNRREFDPEWTEAFLHSMEMDTTKKVYDSLDETLEYIYGSAEVIGLFMNRILGIDQTADGYARMLGRSMQYINFIRDIDEDNQLGRRYLPELPDGLNSLQKEETMKDRDLFTIYIREHIARYRSWQEEAVKGFSYLPWRYRVPIETASDMYDWSARVIERDPYIVYERKVKPSKQHIMLHVLKTGLLRLFG